MRVGDAPVYPFAENRAQAGIFWFARAKRTLLVQVVRPQSALLCTSDRVVSVYN